MTTNEKLIYLMESIRIIANAIDNEFPDEALWEIRRMCAMIDYWEQNNASVAQ